MNPDSKESIWGDKGQAPQSPCGEPELKLKQQTYVKSTYIADVLDIEQVSPRSTIRWRAIASPGFHHAAFVLIIVVEFLIAILTGLGALAMTRALSAGGQKFRRAKSLAVAGLALGFLLYEGGFVAIAGEWFGMWQSAAHDAGPSAFRILITMLGVLIFVALKDEEPA